MKYYIPQGLLYPDKKDSSALVEVDLTEKLGVFKDKETSEDVATIYFHKESGYIFSYFHESEVLEPCNDFWDHYESDLPWPDKHGRIFDKDHALLFMLVKSTFNYLFIQSVYEG